MPLLAHDGAASPRHGSNRHQTHKLHCVLGPQYFLEAGLRRGQDGMQGVYFSCPHLQLPQEGRVVTRDGLVRSPRRAPASPRSG